MWFASKGEKHRGVLCLILVVLLSGCSDEGEGIGEIEVESDLRVDLLVSEPLVIDPVAYAFAESGDLYVVEDRGYPDPAEGGRPALKEGRVALLKDTNGDGEYDTRYEFADELTYPNGIMPWDGGVFVTCAPDIWYFKDTTGDGVADIREVVLTGYHDTKTAQIRMSHPTLGLDGWVYVSSGLNGGDVYSPKYPDRDTVSFSGSDSRFNPHTYEFQTVGGQSQFGMAFDAYGHRFGVSNRHPVLQVVIEPRYLNRNPYLPYNRTVKQVSTVAADAVVFPLTNVVTTSDFIPNLMGQSHYGTFTSASSSYVFYGKGLPEEHQGDVFICESAQNLVQRQKLSQDGAAFRSDLVYEGREFMASEDQWFRPVYVNNGPDDGLYVVDMYRKVIDHPSYIPEEVRGQFDFESGKDMGRIYRIVAKGYKEDLRNKKWFARNAGEAELISRLDSDSEWDRATAFRLLLEGEDLTEGGSALEKIALNSEYPQSRVRALWLLSLKGLLTDEVLMEAYGDEVSGIREQVILLSESRVGSSWEIREMVIGAAQDSDIQVRLQTALVLGAVEREEALDALAVIAVRDGHDEWIREAVLSSVGNRMNDFLSALLRQDNSNTPGYASVMKDVGQMFGLGASVAECRRLARIMVAEDARSEIRIPTVLGLAEGLSGREGTRGREAILTWLLTEVSYRGRKDFREEILREAEDRDIAASRRTNALYLLGYTADDQSLAVLRKALSSEESPSIQKAGIRSLVNQGNSLGGEVLVEEKVWRSFTPEVRSLVVSDMVSHSVFVPILLEAIGEGIVAASDIPSVTRRRLLSSNNDEVRLLAEQAFSSLEDGDRMAIYEEYKSRLEQKGDAGHGEEVFKRSCGVCHSYGGSGGNVGPDLTDVKNQPAEAILLHTLLPNYEVYPIYQTLSVETKDGRHVAGWVVSETENGLTLRMASGSDESILRSSIETIQNTGQSLMPDGLEQTMSKQEMNDLIAYLKQGSEF